MKNRLMLYVFFSISALQLGCVSNEKFNTTRVNYLEDVKQCEERLNSQIKSNLIETQFLTEQIKTLKQELEQAVSSQIKSNRIEKQSLTEQIETLEQVLQQKEKKISILETVIRLFDDSDHTLQSAIQEQLSTQKLDRPD
ncbi:hypothetical protein [Desulfocicer niacini]